MNEIETFAEIGEYFDRPVRIYSSGMQVRLAFSVATAIRPDILIVDEALSVGDRFFSQKSFDRIKRFLDDGTTLLFVSHDGNAVKTLCDRAVLLDSGTIAAIGTPETIIDRYNGAVLGRVNAALPKTAESMPDADTGPVTGHASVTRSCAVEGFTAMRAQVDTEVLRLVDFHMTRRGGAPVIAINSGEEVVIRYRLQANTAARNLFFGVALRDRLAVSVFNTNTAALGMPAVDLSASQTVEVTFRMKVPLVPGHYGICIGAAGGDAGNGFFDTYHLNLINVSVLEVHAPPGGLRFGGMVDLGPECHVGVTP